MSLASTNAFPPRSVSRLLRVEAAALLGVSVLAYGALGLNWWLFAVLLLTPDLSMLAGLRNPELGSRAYNAAHTTSVPIVLGAAGWLTGNSVLMMIALIWLAHIGMDRVLGYGLKYPGEFHATHLGPIGKAKAESLADAR